MTSHFAINTYSTGHFRPVSKPKDYSLTLRVHIIDRILCFSQNINNPFKVRFGKAFICPSLHRNNVGSSLFRCYCLTCFGFLELICACVCIGEQGPCLLDLDLHTALKLRVCKRPAALPGYPDTMSSICKLLHNARTVPQPPCLCVRTSLQALRYTTQIFLRGHTKFKRYGVMKFVRHRNMRYFFCPSGHKIRESGQK